MDGNLHTLRKCYDGHLYHSRCRRKAEDMDLQAWSRTKLHEDFPDHFRKKGTMRMESLL